MLNFKSEMSEENIMMIVSILIFLFIVLLFMNKPKKSRCGCIRENLRNKGNKDNKDNEYLMPKWVINLKKRQILMSKHK